MSPRQRAGRVSEIAFTEYSDTANRVVVDTHAWVGFLDPSAYALGAQAIRTIQAAQQSGGMLVSDAAVWEISLKAGRGSMRLGLPLRGWIERARSAPGTRMVPFTLELMVRSAELGTGAPSDPFDRAMIVTAIAAGAPLVTADRKILAWAKASGMLRVVPAR